MMKRLTIVLALVVPMLTSTMPVMAAQQLTEAQKQQLFLKGAKLWPIYCNHCHNARNPAEYAPYQWNAIMMHMRTQGNLPADDAQAILEFLKRAR
jgi:hypothetical protein